jgi:hypothetical protein
MSNFKSFNESLINSAKGHYTKHSQGADMTIRRDDSKPFDTTNGEQPVFSPALVSEKQLAIADAYNKMTILINTYIKGAASLSLDMLYKDIWQFNATQKYLDLAGDSLGKPMVRTTFIFAIRNYIDSKE